MNIKYLLFLMLIILTSCTTGAKVAENRAQAESLRNLGEAYLSSGNASLALRELLKANRLDPDDPYTHNDLGLAYLSKGRVDKAISHLKKAIELKPDYAPARNNLGSAYIAQQNWDKAIETLKPLTENILYTTPQFAEANIAFAYLRKKQYSKAERHYKNSLDLSPEYTKPMRGLSRLYRLKGDLEKSLKMIDKAINISPRNGELYFQKGKTLEFMGESDEAELSYQKAISYGNDRIIEKAEEAINNL